MKQYSLENINFLKVLFMIEVLLYHFIRKMGVWNNGGYAVEFFFMVSGYLLVTQSVSDRQYLSVGDFLWSKIKRFFPLVAVIGGVNCILTGGGGLWKAFNNLIFSLNIWGIKFAYCLVPECFSLGFLVLFLFD